MVCAPCQKKAEARRQAMLNQVALTNPKAAKAYEANTSASLNLGPKTTRVLPRHVWPTKPIVSNTKVQSKTVWNEWYQAFMMRKDK